MELKLKNEQKLQELVLGTPGTLHGYFRFENIKKWSRPHIIHQPKTAERKGVSRRERNFQNWSILGSESDFFFVDSTIIIFDFRVVKQTYADWQFSGKSYYHNLMREFSKH